MNPDWSFAEAALLPHRSSRIVAGQGQPELDQRDRRPLPPFARHVFKSCKGRLIRRL
jgi:hypothetical protein